MNVFVGTGWLSDLPDRRDKYMARAEAHALGERNATVRRGDARNKRRLHGRERSRDECAGDIRSKRALALRPCTVRNDESVVAENKNVDWESFLIEHVGFSGG